MAIFANNRGREASWPFQISPKGWLDIIWRIKDEFRRDNLTLIAAGIAFYTLLAIFPGLAALVSVWGMVADPAQVSGFIGQFESFLPADAFSILQKQAQDIASRPAGRLSFGLGIGIFLAAFGASRGVKSLIMGLNIVYEEEEKRGFFHLNLLGVGLTFFLVFAVLLCLAVILAVPDLLKFFLPPFIVGLWRWLRWVFLFFAANVILAVLYRFGPCRVKARWQWLATGSVIATFLWLLVSAVFSFYVQHYGSYNETYGSIGAVIVLLMWFWLSALTILIGAELNAEIEHQTEKDSTIGPEKPMGERGARMADTLGKTRP